MADGAFTHTFSFRVRYAETDQMGTFYNARALEWFEVARSELSRNAGLPYTVWEERGYFLPVVEAHVKYHGKAVYDDLLEHTLSVEAYGNVRLRFTYDIRQATNGQKVCSGYTIHALLNREGRPARVPAWILESFDLTTG